MVTNQAQQRDGDLLQGYCRWRKGPPLKRGSDQGPELGAVKQRCVLGERAGTAKARCSRRHRGGLCSWNKGKGRRIRSRKCRSMVS